MWHRSQIVSNQRARFAQYVRRGVGECTAIKLLFNDVRRSIVPYLIAVTKIFADRVEAKIQGPGITGSGGNLLFGSPAEAETFVRALNFAFAQGFFAALQLDQQDATRNGPLAVFATA